jgi:hypothetical protein
VHNFNRTKGSRNIGTFDSRVENTEAEPLEVVVNGRQVVHVEHHGRPSAGAVRRFHARLAVGEANWRYRSRDLRGIGFPVSALVELNRRQSRLRIVLIHRSDLVWFEPRRERAQLINQRTKTTSMIPTTPTSRDIFR